MNIAIIGAGAAGLVAARALHQRRPDLTITIYEKSRGLGGRVATRRRDGFAFDHGAQLFKTPSPELERLVTQELDAAGLHDIELPVWTFDSAGTIAEGDPQQNAEPKWTYRDGVNRLGKLLGEGLDVRREVRIAALRRAPGDDRAETKDEGRRTKESHTSTQNSKLKTQNAPLGPQSSVLSPYTLLDVNGAAVGEADVVLLTPPAPQTADLLAASDLAPDTRDALLAELGRARYRRCISFALAYDRPIPRPFYALVNTDRQHPIAWLALEHTKGPERCPPGNSLLIPQMAAQWSLDNWDAPLEQLAPLVADLTGTLLGEELDAPLWCDMQRWRYALPDAGADFATLNQTGAPHGLFFAGDYTAGQGRVHLAIESGWRVAEMILEGV